MGLALVGSQDEPGPSRREIAATLRAIADDIDSGLLPVIEAVVVTNGEKGLHIHAAGDTDAASASMLLGAGQQKLQQALL